MLYACDVLPGMHVLMPIPMSMLHVDVCLSQASALLLFDIPSADQLLTGFHRYDDMCATLPANMSAVTSPHLTLPLLTLAFPGVSCAALTRIATAIHTAT